MIKQARNIPVLVAAAFAAAACGGGSSGSSNNMPAPMPAPLLAIGAIADVSVPQDTVVGPLAVPVSEGQMSASAFTVSATSSDTDLLPPGSIAVQTSNGAPTITLTPADGAVGGATITVKATDPKGQSAQQSFKLMFNAVNASFATLVAGTFVQSEAATPVSVHGMTYVQDADDPSAFASLLQ
jgi:hypothetical protein